MHQRVVLGLEAISLIVPEAQGSEIAEVEVEVVEVVQAGQQATAEIAQALQAELVAERQEELAARSAVLVLPTTAVAAMEAPSTPRSLQREPMAM